MQTAAEIIDLLGGTVKVADALNLTPSTVSSWKSSKRGIPRWWHRDIEALAEIGKINLSLLQSPHNEAA